MRDEPLFLQKQWRSFTELCNCEHNYENVATFGHIELDPPINDDSDYEDKE
jgi:hypothetical protein